VKITFELNETLVLPVVVLKDSSGKGNHKFYERIICKFSAT